MNIKTITQLLPRTFIRHDGNDLYLFRIIFSGTPETFQPIMLMTYSASLAMATMAGITLTFGYQLVGPEYPEIPDAETEEVTSGMDEETERKWELASDLRSTARFCNDEEMQELYRIAKENNLGIENEFLPKVTNQPLPAHLVAANQAAKGYAPSEAEVKVPRAVLESAISQLFAHGHHRVGHKLLELQEEQLGGFSPVVGGVARYKDDIGFGD